MDTEFEKRICGAFFESRCAQRLAYELSSAKKRGRFFGKLAHTSQNYLKDCIFDCFSMPAVSEDIIEFMGKGECYFLSEYDAGFYDISQRLAEVWSNGSVYMIVNKECSKAYLETEYDFSVHEAFMLKIKQKE